MQIERLVGGAYLSAANTVTAFSKLLDYDGSNNVIYIGVAPSGAAATDQAWTISNITYSGSNATSVKWGSLGASNLVWNNRASYTYS